ncbi:MAG: hypothetical protein ACJ0Q6_00065 [Candidatus Azotimanducaceae bacterium]|uniref:HAD family hydrolase n=1 Tax=OM182 bacterium TaxID=2510334 RepID=A0A520S332_9GAMM|nr:MAG: hypothetical protein EVA68_03165 [OM182 bacterium]
MRILKVEPKDCIVFEDSLNDIKAAALAGTKAYTLRSAFLDDEDLKSANSLFSSYHELLPVIIDW